MTNDEPLEYELVWLHLSDLHFGDTSQSDSEHRSAVLDRLILDFEDGRTRGVPTPDVIVVTGDVSATGGVRNADEYEQAGAFLSRMASTVGSHVKLVLVPGNHDSVRAGPNNAQTYRMLSSARVGSESIDDMLASPADRAILADRFEGFGRLLSSLATVDDGIHAEDILGGWTRTIEGKSLSFEFVGLNTSLLSNDDQDEGRLQLGYGQLRGSAVGAADRASRRVRVAVSHHPLHWMRDWDEIEPLVTGSFDLHLYGHLHIARASRSAIAANDGMIGLGAGLGYDKRGGSWIGASDYSYSVCAIGWDPSGSLRLRVWPRVWVPRGGGWRGDTGVLAEGAAYWTQTVPGGRRRSASPSISDDTLISARREWSTWSDESIRSFGRRRTAYPLDLTIQELLAKNVSIPTAVVLYGAVHAKRIALVQSALATVEPKCSLLLGEPGAGKSVAAYELANHIKVHGGQPIVLRASEFKALLSPGYEYASIFEDALSSPAASNDAPKVLIVDGLDEISGSTSLLTLAGTFLLQASQKMAVVVTCRKREFEDEISKWMSGGVFEAISLVKEWSAQDEFADYVRRLVGAGLLGGTDILETVTESVALSGLVRRPLFARMLTFVGAEDSALIVSATNLYSRYLDRLAVTCEASLSSAGFIAGSDVWSAWTKTARLAFEKNLMSDEQMNMSAIEALLRRSEQLDVAAFRRILAFVADVQERGAYRVAQFVHYSFYEFLVARSVLEKLESTALTEVAIRSLCASLSHDLPRQMRHFLVELLRLDVGINDVELVLRSTYEAASESELRPAIRLTICNLIAYIASRGLDSSSTLLSELVDHEQDPFLRNSLLWAVCHAGAQSSELTFIRELDASSVRREMNRGYLLYYHGDLSREQEPPFVDRPPWTSWSFTRSEVGDMINSSNYAADVRPQRQAIDLYTLFDFAINRGEVLDGQIGAAARRHVERLWGENRIAMDVRIRLLNQSAVALGSAAKAQVGGVSSK